MSYPNCQTVKLENETLRATFAGNAMSKLR